jgi:tetratricopeptide (TPR) repeat protein
MAKNWTTEEEEHIRENYLTQTYGELAEHFSVTTKAMESKIRRMGLKKQAILAEAISSPEPAPVVQYKKPTVPEEPTAEPIESIHKLDRRIEVYEETQEERTDRLEKTRAAAETEKARREESRRQAPVAKALKTFEAGVKKLLDGKNSEAAKDFQALLDDPPTDLGLVLRARQYLSAAISTKTMEPNLTTAEDMYNHGVVLLNDGDIEGALKILGAAAKQAPTDDRIMYVRALALGISGDEEAATEQLQAAIKANETNRVYAHNDPDFAPLHGNPRFQEMMEPQGEDDID